VRSAYVSEYLKAIGGARFVPVDDREKERMLAFYQLEKCIYEIRYELNNRPDWVEIPLSGLRQAMAEEA
jgi:maltose alpha-D-glucosyltransferase / alpha-amylase